MEKKLFQSTMSHIKMPDFCEREILRRAEELSEQNDCIRLRVRRKGRSFIAVIAACLCVVMVGTVTVSAFNGNNWLAGFFRVPEWSGESSVITEQREEIVDIVDGYVSPIYNFKSEGWNADKFEPVGAICNGNILYAAFRYTTPEEDGVVAEHMGQWYDPNTLVLSVNGQEVDFYRSKTYSQLQDDGSAIIYEQFYLSDVIIGKSIEVSTAIIDTYKFVNSDKEQPADEDICRLSFSVDIQKNTKVITYYVDEVLKKEIQPLGVNACVWLEKADINLFFMSLSGEQSSSHPYLFDNTDMCIITDDGEEIEGIVNVSTHMYSGGKCNINIDYPVPIAPETIIAIKFGDQIINLKD